MKYRIAIIFLICFFACKQSEKSTTKIEKPVLDGFGVLRIGMPNAEFKAKKLYSEQKKHDDYLISYEVKDLKINEKIILKDVYLEFHNDRLSYIGTECNDDFLSFLKSNFGQKGNSIITNSNEIFCGIEKLNSQCVIGLYEKNWRPDYD